VTLLYLVIFAASVLLSFLLTRYVRAVCRARNWVSVPSLDRHMHARPLPRLGGIAIFLAFLP
jgi:UDP-GlcNAc:undecaprenyl-phosphate GlcNAc-1-phosphate transferase